MTLNTRHTKLRMARPKQFSDRTTMAFPPGTFAAIEEAIKPGEDRSDLIRAAVGWEVMLRRSAIYGDLTVHLLVNESIEDFCLKAIAKAVAQRKTALSREDAPNEGKATAE